MNFTRLALKIRKAVELECTVIIVPDGQCYRLMVEAQHVNLGVINFTKHMPIKELESIISPEGYEGQLAEECARKIWEVINDPRSLACTED